MTFFIYDKDWKYDQWKGEREKNVSKVSAYRPKRESIMFYA